MRYAARTAAASNSRRLTKENFYFGDSEYLNKNREEKGAPFSIFKQRPEIRSLDVGTAESSGKYNRARGEITAKVVTRRYVHPKSVEWKGTKRADSIVELQLLHKDMGTVNREKQQQ